MNTLCLIISILTIFCLVLSVIFLPKIKIGKLNLQTFWIVALIGALSLIITGVIEISKVLDGIFSDGIINPIKILVLFFSMTIISIILDEQGFFSYLASVVAKKCQKSQMMLLICFYVCISTLTVFTSNDIIILTFTPFICALCKNLKINPLPYLISEFVAANTLSMMLIIGNPTNIYLSQSFGVSFFDYLLVMIIPTIVVSIIAILLLVLIFKKTLSKKIEEVEIEKVEIKNKPLTVISVSHLIVCLIVLAISNYINLEMYLISLVLCLSLTIIILAYCIINKNYKMIVNSYKRVPYTLAIFVISMFIVVLSLENYGYLSSIGTYLNSLDNDIFSYGIISFLTCSITNNIPMSVMFSEIINTSDASINALYATVIGSNIGAYFTPLGALAGIMWLDLLNRNGVKLSFGKFIKYLMPISVIVLVISLFILSIVI